MDGKRGNVLHAKRTGNVNHPTEKPVDLIEQLLSNDDARTIYEPFAGSGTTIVAAENLNRKCYAVEISPNYCAVILDRMTAAFPGVEIKKIEG
jgi:DNA modification methylase